MTITLALLLAGQAAAGSTPPDQTAGPQTPPSADAGRLGPAQASPGGDVVVTARRRNESAQRVPIAISVIGGAALAETGTYNVNRLSQVQPTLQFYSTNPDRKSVV